MWVWMSAGALAATPAVTAEELPAAIAAIEQRQQQSKMIVGSSWDTNTVLKSMLAAHPELGGELHRVPESAPEAEAAIHALLDKEGLHCGVWVTDMGSGRFAVHEVGQCVEEPQPVRVATPLPTPSPAPQAPVPASSAAPAPAPVPAAPAPAPWPVPAPAAPVPIPTPIPTAASAQQGWDQLLMQLSAPDPTAAILESLIVGFGSGHFYCNDKQGGYAHLGVQAGGLVLSAIGGAVAANGSSSGAAVESVGIAAFAVSRIVEIATDPYAARKEARRMVANRKK